MGLLTSHAIAQSHNSAPPRTTAATEEPLALLRAFHEARGKFGELLDFGWSCPLRYVSSPCSKKITAMIFTGEEYQNLIARLTGTSMHLKERQEKPVIPCSLKHASSGNRHATRSGPKLNNATAKRKEKLERTGEKADPKKICLLHGKKPLESPFNWRKVVEIFSAKSRLTFEPREAKADLSSKRPAPEEETLLLEWVSTGHLKHRLTAKAIALCARK